MGEEEVGEEKVGVEKAGGKVWEEKGRRCWGWRKRRCHLSKRDRRKNPLKRDTEKKMRKG